MEPNKGANAENMEIDDLFTDDGNTPAQNKGSNNNGDNEENKQKPKSDLTEAMIKRINEVKINTEKETRDTIAKENNFESYEAMQAAGIAQRKAKKLAEEAKVIKEAGFEDDQEAIKKLLDPIVNKRLEDDPRLEQLAAYQDKEKARYIEEQLTSINKTTGQKLKLTDLSQDTLDLWKKGINLEQAFYATQGKELLTKGINKNNKGTLNHLAPGGGAGTTKTRGYTAKEKEMYASIMGAAGYEVDETELAKKTVEINEEG